VNLNSNIQAITNFELKTSSSNRNILKPGERLVGTVLKIQDDGKALIDFGKCRVLAEVNFKIRSGEKLPVRVVQKQERIVLVLEEHGSKSSQKTRHIIQRSQILPQEIIEKLPSLLTQLLKSDPEGAGVPRAVQNSILKVNTHFEPLHLGGPVSQLLSKIQSHVEDSGFFFEKRIEKVIIHLLKSSQNMSANDLKILPEMREIFSRDLKSHLLILKHFLTTDITGLRNLDGKNPDKIRVLIDQLLQNIATQQNVVGKKTLTAEPTQVFTFVIPLKESEENARLKVYYPKERNGKSKRGFRASLLLFMDKLGEIRTDLFLLEKELSISFFVKEESIKKLFEGSIQEIHEFLDPLFDSLIIKTVISEKKIADFQTEDRFIVTDSMVDVRA